ncbi:hypothetical protein BCR32DRAFT_290746 [Anaeromyces robustus]|uniref:CBM1 domain-containing protein n=1 Tax=Anaeromyces robustus TaxID=1754192 RepID=A0A1Y1XIY6_9FUNG|nr:hypothetical protein BCR32DRAFT_290746 [Anaeromyces robustus]|eukprot:ORX85324.1 hypothetical protein BCR32DRAFT_290746 [Anaeromyces robustus]
MKFTYIFLLSLYFVYALAYTTKTLPNSTTKTVPNTSSTKSIPVTSTTKSLYFTSSTKSIPKTSTSATKSIPITSSTKSIPKTSTSTTKSLYVTSSTKAIPSTTTTKGNTSVPTNSNNSNYYYSCGAQDYDCKNQKSNECYSALSQCWSQPWSTSVEEECNAINMICSKIWN